MRQHSYSVDVVGTENIVTEITPIASIKIDNPSGMWLYVVDILKYIPPYTLGWISNMLPVTNSVRIQYVDALSSGVTSSATGGPITVTTYDKPQLESHGLDYTSASATDVSAVTTAVQAVETKVDASNTKLDTIATNQAAQATATKQDTQSTKLDTIAANQAAQATAAAQTTAQTSLDAITLHTKPINSAPVISVVSIGVAATLIRTTTGEEALAMFNEDTAKTIYVGPSGVTTATGFPITPGSAFAIDLSSGQSWYGITTAGTASLRLLRATIT